MFDFIATVLSWLLHVVVLPLIALAVLCLAVAVTGTFLVLRAVVWLTERHRKRLDSDAAPPGDPPA